MILRCLWVLVATFIISAKSFADLPIVPVHEDGLPKGDYPKFCAPCSIDSTKLSCYCKAPDNKSHKRTLDISLCDPLIVTAKRGVLTCTDDYAKADYVHIRRGPLESEEELQKFLPKPIQNDLFNDSLLPEGDYKSYCNSCVITEGGILECQCKIDGFFANFLWSGLISEYWYSASLPLLSCKEVNQVTFVGGGLHCSLDDYLKVSGLGEKNLYRSCEGCRFKGNDLLCQVCRKTSCGWSRKDRDNNLHIVQNVVLKNARECRKEIRNCNGTLRCGGCWRWDFWDEWESRRPISGRNSGNYCNPNSPYPF